MRELERRRLKAKPTRGIGQQKAKIDMVDVALIVKQNITIVPVLDLENVTND